jgi:rhamnulokinase
VAIDLGAESCRISLLRWQRDEPRITMVRRFAHAPRDGGAAGLRWNLAGICEELETGLQACAELAPEGIDAIGATGWAVDYVRLNAAGQPQEPPFCYRDSRAIAAMESVHAILPAKDLYARTGVQIQPLNTIYQLFADKTSGAGDSAPWVNLPEYILHWLGAPRVAEYTNATHTGLIDPERRQWSDAIFSSLGLSRAAAPELVSPGTVLGSMRCELTRMPAFAATRLVAPACHDTASAVAGIPERTGKWAYISSGTWSLAGTIRTETLRTPAVFESGFTNLGAASGQVLFHCGIPGMWLLQQCMRVWEQQRAWTVEDLIGEARRLPAPDALLDLNDPSFLPPGDMVGRIDAQRRRQGLALLPEGSAAAPHYASLIFHSLAGRYAALLREVRDLTGETMERIRIVGGGSRNEYLNGLIAEATGLAVQRCSVESATLGNLAVQWAALEGQNGAVSPQAMIDKAAALSGVQFS